jgi:hypothetical protein
MNGTGGVLAGIFLYFISLVVEFFLSYSIHC